MQLATLLDCLSPYLLPSSVYSLCLSSKGWHQAMCESDWAQYLLQSLYPNVQLPSPKASIPRSQFATILKESWINEAKVKTRLEDTVFHEIHSLYSDLDELSRNNLIDLTALGWSVLDQALHFVYYKPGKKQLEFVEIGEFKQHSKWRSSRDNTGWEKLELGEEDVRDILMSRLRNDSGRLEPSHYALSCANNRNTEKGYHPFGFWGPSDPELEKQQAAEIMKENSANGILFRQFQSFVDDFMELVFRSGREVELYRGAHAVGDAIGNLCRDEEWCILLKKNGRYDQLVMFFFVLSRFYG